MSSITKRKSSYKPVPAPQDVAVEWLTVPVSDDLAASVSLNGVEYAFHAHLHLGKVAGYRFIRPDERTGSALVYDVDAQTLVCDCRDSEVRRHRCKHSWAGTKLLESLDAARQTQLDAEQQADREELPGWTDAGLDRLWRESQEEEWLASGFCLDDGPAAFLYRVGD